MSKSNKIYESFFCASFNSRFDAKFSLAQCSRFEYSNEFLQSLATVQKHCHLNAIYRLRDTFVVHNLYNFMCAMQFALCHYFLNCFAASSQFRWMYRPHKHSQTLISLSLLEIIWIRGKKTKSMFTQLLREEAKIL